MKEKRDPIVLPADADIAAVKAKAPPRFADAIEFARETGMREEEIFGLTHRQVAGDEIIIRGKRNKLRVIPLSRKARRIIDKQPQHIGSPYVFWHSDGQRWASPAARFQAIRLSAEKAARKRHRSSTASASTICGTCSRSNTSGAKRGSLYDLQMILGHDSVTTTEIYLDHLTPEQRKAAMHGAAHKGGTRLAVWDLTFWRSFQGKIGGTEGERRSVYKTAALPTELIRQAAVFLGFCGKRVNRQRAESATEV
jgi:integrase/recombinase XerD